MGIEELIKKFKEYSTQDTQVLEKAYHFSKDAHINQRRASGDIYFTHCETVAEILLDFKMDIPTIAAGLLHDILEDTQISLEVLKKEFGEEIANLVLGVTKIDSIKFQNKDEAQAENWRRMILATAKDIRVILIKLADRLHNMRTLNFLTPEKQIENAQETLSLYAPLAQRLGMYQIKSELEDLAFKHLFPQEYDNLQQKLQTYYSAKETLLENFKKDLDKHLASSQIPYRIVSRAKNIYSIYRKMQKQNKSFEEIQDTLGVRIITDTVMNCYALLGMIHAAFKPVVGSFTDYISVPKPNLYQSLHTTVVTSSGEFVEIQIRTEDMHRTCEYGISAHWKYKVEETEKDDNLNEKLNWLRQWIEWLGDLSSPREFIESFKTELELDHVYVFTPKGEVKSLPVGSTPIDFAYAIHSDIGNTCIGAKVNNKMVNFEYELKSSDIVEIITRKNSAPKKDWLKIVKTARARSKIRKYLREHNMLDE